MKINVGSILASVTMITIVSLTKSLDANNFLDDCSGILLKNTTRGTYDEWFKLGAAVRVLYWGILQYIIV